jgi:hypothetical protein
MEKLINSPENVVLEPLAGLGAAFSHLVKVHFNPNYITRVDAPIKNKTMVDALEAAIKAYKCSIGSGESIEQALSKNRTAKDATR